jgi:redox-sensitive bicupin YhaK (pirin superfamily)
MLSGEFEHEDSTGAKGVMSPGDVQWMKTGSGVIHSEMPAMTDGKLHGFQLWLNMPAKYKMNKPEYIYIDAKKMQIYKDNEKKINVIAGKYRDAEGPVKGHNVEPVYLDIDIEKDKEFNFNLPSTHNSLIYLIEGEIKVGDKNHDEVKDSTLIILTRGEKLKVSSLSKAKFLLISGKPIGEPIARGGPFVMNTKAEVLQAVQDYHNGTFVK